MGALQQLYEELLRAGYPPAEIPQIITQLGNAARQNTERAIGAGYTHDYVNKLTGPELFGLQNTTSLLTGQGEADRQQSLLSDAANAQAQRNQGGFGLLDYERNRNLDANKDAGDPFNTVRYLDAVSRTGEQGNPVQSLINEGFRIQPTVPSTYQDPRYQQLLDSMYEFNRPRNVAENIAETQQGQQQGIDATHGPGTYDRLLQARQGGATQEGWNRLAGMAAGGNVMLPEPVVGVGAMTGTPYFTAAENGPEMAAPTPQGVSFRPMDGVSRRLGAGRQAQILGSAGFSGSGRPPQRSFALGGTIQVNSRVTGGSAPRRPSTQSTTGSTGSAFQSVANAVSPAPVWTGSREAAENYARFDAGRASQPSAPQQSSYAPVAPQPGQPMVIITSDGRRQVIYTSNPQNMGKVYDSSGGLRTVERALTSQDLAGAQAYEQNDRATRYFRNAPASMGLEPLRQGIGTYGTNFTDHPYKTWYSDGSGRPVLGYKDGVPIYGDVVGGKVFDPGKGGTMQGYNSTGGAVFSRPSPGGETPVSRSGGGRSQSYRSQNFVPLDGRELSPATPNNSPGNRAGGGTPATPGTPGTPGSEAGTRDPAQGAAVALGRALERNPFTQGSDMVAALLRGEPPPPGSITQRILANLDPTFRDTLSSVLRGFRYRLEDYEAEIQRYAVPGIGVGSVWR